MGGSRHGCDAACGVGSGGGGGVRVDDPTSLPEWRAISLECKLTRQLCGTGLTSIGRANYADGMGEYYAAFFSLAIGLERLGKLIFCFSEQQESGSFPSDASLRKFGHNLKEIVDKVEVIASQRRIQSGYKPLEFEICGNIIKHLSSFSAANIGRYANFSVMSEGSSTNSFEPISKWWQLVGEPVLNKHFRGTRRETIAKRNAQVMEAALGQITLVRHTSENGDPIRNLEIASFRTAENEIFQKYGRYYSFTLVRWLSEIFRELTRVRGYQEGGELWFGHYELFNSFTVDDQFGLTRKIWPLT